jgi:hypothetical protein
MLKDTIVVDLISRFSLPRGQEPSQRLHNPGTYIQYSN